MKIIKYILIAVICVIIVFAFFLIKGKKSGTRLVNEKHELKDIKESGKFAELNNVHYKKNVKEFTEYDITAKKVEYYKEEDFSKFEDIDVRFYTQKGDEYHLTGRTGTYDVKNELITAEGDVFLKTKSGYKFKSNSLQYNNKEKTVFASSHITIENQSKKLTLEGAAMEFDLQNERIKINKEVKAHIGGQ